MENAFGCLNELKARNRSFASCSQEEVSMTEQFVCGNKALEALHNRFVKSGDFFILKTRPKHLNFTLRVVQISKMTRALRLGSTLTEEEALKQRLKWSCMMNKKIPRVPRASEVSRNVHLWTEKLCCHLTIQGEEKIPLIERLFDVTYEWCHRRRRARSLHSLVSSLFLWSFPWKEEKLFHLIRS